MTRYCKDPASRKAEETLYKFFEAERKVDAIRNTNLTLSQQLKDIERRLRTNDFFSLGVNFGSVSYEEKVQTSISNTSDQEKALMKCVNELLKEKKEIEQKIFDNNKIIRKIQRDNIYIKDFIDGLDELDKNIVIARYKKKKDGQILAEEINMSRQGELNKRKKILKKFIKWMEE